MKCKLIGTSRNLAQLPVPKQLKNQLNYLGEMPELTTHEECVPFAVE